MDPEHYGAPGALLHRPDFASGENGVLVYFTWALVTDTEGNMIGLHSMQ